jgi:hypothetical protein
MTRKRHEGKEDTQCYRRHDSLPPYSPKAMVVHQVAERREEPFFAEPVAIECELPEKASWHSSSNPIP